MERNRGLEPEPEKMPEEGLHLPAYFFPDQESLQTFKEMLESIHDTNLVAYFDNDASMFIFTSPPVIK